MHVAVLRPVVPSILPVDVLAFRSVNGYGDKTYQLVRL